MLSKKERLRTRKFSMEEPYSRASDYDLMNTPLSGGKYTVRQTPSLRETIITPIQNNTSQDLSNSSTLPSNPALTKSISGPATIGVPSRSFSSATNTIVNPIPNMPNSNQPNFYGTFPADPALTRSTSGPASTVVQPLLSRSFSGATNSVGNPIPNMQGLNQSNFYANTSPSGMGFISQPQNIDIYPIYNTSPRTNLPAKTVQSTANSSGIFTFRPREGQFPFSNKFVGKIDPYCKIKIGHHAARTSSALKQGNSPVWSDAIALERRHNEQFAEIKVKDHDRFVLDDSVGEAKIPLNEVATQGKTSQWYPIYKKGHQAGQILLDISFEPRNLGFYH